MKKIKTLIKKAQLEKALELSLEELPHKYHKEIELLIARNSKYKNKFNKGTITQSEYSKEWVIFTESLLDILNNNNNEEIFIETEKNIKSVDIEKKKTTSKSSNRIHIYGAQEVNFIYNIQDKSSLKKENINYHFPDSIEISSDMNGRHFISSINNKYWKRLDYCKGPSFKKMEHIDWYEGDDNEFFVGLYDIDQDGIDEIFIGVNHTTDFDFNYQVQINFFKFYPPFFEQHCGRSENWKFIGAIECEWSNIAPRVRFEKNSVIIVYHHRGFFAEWYYVKDRFIQLEK